MEYVQNSMIKFKYSTGSPSHGFDTEHMHCLYSPNISYAVANNQDLL